MAKKPDKKPKASRGMPRSLIYAMIPGGFLLLVLILVLAGQTREDAAEEPPTVVEQPAQPQQ
ncbi:hypothetical protein [Natronohydrobacter thiooxidans]|jgi:TRAP-type C4-dicarboxylate transport system permease small subunit|uniref:hypothetical protein n=1 Tax=Natronohydrobacter thiooxidans TaxID=87172 RepID=UPI0008FF5966|nr:hypothetical protein [Natronohydrobacter thiooxidans]